MTIIRLPPTQEVLKKARSGETDTAMTQSAIDRSGHGFEFSCSRISRSRRSLPNDRGDSRQTESRAMFAYHRRVPAMLPMSVADAQHNDLTSHLRLSSLTTARLTVAKPGY
jgi:hypothetical protein